MKSQYSLWRQSDNVDDIIINQTDPPVGDLLGLYFPMIYDLKDIAIDIIEPEWVEGYAITNTVGAATTANADYKYAFVDASDYDYILLPIAKPDTASAINPVTGMGNGAGENIDVRSPIASPAAAVGAGAMGYILYHVTEDDPVAAITMLKDTYVPILAFKGTPN